MDNTIHFDTPNLAKAVEALTDDELDRLSFGAVEIDPQGVVRKYNRTEYQDSGLGSRSPLGKHFFADVAPCMDNGYFRGRIDKALREGKLDISLSFVGDFSDRDRELKARVQSSRNGGMWVFIHRPATE